MSPLGAVCLGERLQRGQMGGVGTRRPFHQSQRGARVAGAPGHRGGLAEQRGGARTPAGLGGALEQQRQLGGAAGGAEPGDGPVHHRALARMEVRQGEQRLQCLRRQVHQRRGTAIERLGLVRPCEARQADRGPVEAAGILAPAMHLGEERERLPAALPVGVGGHHRLQRIRRIVQRPGGQRGVPQPQLQPGALRGGKVGSGLQRAPIVGLGGLRPAGSRGQLSAGEERPDVVGLRPEQLVPRLGGEERLSRAGQQLRPLGQQRRGPGGDRPGPLGEELRQGTRIRLHPGPARGEGRVQLGRPAECPVLGARASSSRPPTRKAAAARSQLRAASGPT